MGAPESLYRIMGGSSFDSKRPFTKQVVSSLALFLMLLALPADMQQLRDCSTATAVVSTCSPYIGYGTPEPLPGTPCCDATTALSTIAPEEHMDGHIACRCLMGLITSCSPNASDIAALPAFCSVPVPPDSLPVSPSLS